MMGRNEDMVDFGTQGKEIRDKTTSIKNMVRSLELRLKGHIWSADGGKFIYTGDVLAGAKVIQKAIGLLQPFCEDANLITAKDFRTFSRQKYRVNSTFNSTLLAEGVSIASNYQVIMEMFMDTLQNIGDIILGSKDLMKYQFGHTDEPKEYDGDLQ